MGTPVINPDIRTINGAATINVLSNDLPAAGQAPLRVTSILDPQNGLRKLSDEDLAQMFKEAKAKLTDEESGEEDVARKYVNEDRTLAEEEDEASQEKDQAKEGRKLQDSNRSLQGGTCTIVNDQQEVRYTPPTAGWTGNDICRYQACDRFDQCGTALIQMEVLPPIPTRQPTRRPTNQPTRGIDIRPDNVTAQWFATFIDVLDNDFVPPGRGGLCITGVLQDYRRELEVAEEKQENEEEDGERKLQNGPVPSLQGGQCSWTDDRQQVRYIPPSESFRGSDRCRYRACECNNFAVCGTANVFITVITPVPTRRPTRNPTRRPTRRPNFRP